MDYIIEIHGGIGKHVMATSFIKWLNEKYPKKKISVISAYPEIFEYNPRVWRNLRIEQPYLFEDYIKNADYRKGNPYELQEFYREKDKKHLMQVFPKAYGFNHLIEKPESEIFLTKGEELDGKMYCQQNGPLITFHAIGGLPPGMMPNRMKVDSSQRDLPGPLALKIVQYLISKGFKVLQLRTKVEPPIPGCLQLELPFRNLIPIVKNAVGHVGIDSSWMHVAGCFKKPMMTFWGGTHKDSFGYFHEDSINVASANAMHGRPYFAVHDIAGMYPYKDKREGLEFDLSDREIEKYLDKFVTLINSKINKGQMPNKNGGQDEQIFKLDQKNSV